ncbi:hypothetical protein B0H11DRAFT_1934001 [Mycena galericulata]|nr:hypothetical protein B0H11DRAFT_1933978 [Mycena galericulata]KAJ7440114.1 hypothetical protein B0H11DRAFT_1934001 [Mycena galericulata]
MTAPNIYRRRHEFIDDDFNKRVVRLAAEPACHSDDEPDPGSTEYLIHEKEGRDAAVTKLFRIIITRRSEEAKSRKRNRARWARKPGLGPSEISRRLPTKVPFDYFSAKFFNSMSVRQRASYMHNGIALPTIEHCDTWKKIEEWRGLDYATFMKKYGNAKLALYNIPTAAELARLEVEVDGDDHE